MVRTILALMTTMLLGGIWHGANYTFIAWGAIHGAALVLEHLIGGRQARTAHKRISMRTLFGWTYTLLTVFIAWVFFRAVDIHQGVQIVSAMFQSIDLNSQLLPTEFRQIAFLILALMLLQIPFEWLLNKLRRERLPPHIAIGIAFWAIIASIVLGDNFIKL